MGARALALRFAAAVTALALLAPSAGAQDLAYTGEALTQARERCLTAVRAKLGDRTSVNDAVQALRDLAGSGACAAVPVPAPPPALPEILAAVEADLADAERDYGCAAPGGRPSCEALTAARARHADLRLFRSGKVAAIRALPADHFSRARAFVWVIENNAFGAQPGVGTSLMRLVVRAVGADSLARRIGPDTAYYDVEAETVGSTAPCQVPCGNAVAEVVSLFALFDALDRGFMAATAGNFDSAITSLEGIVGRWEAYHFGGGQGRAQLPWELALNSVLYARQRDDRIWREPPRGAVTLFHPTTGLAFNNTEGDKVLVNAVELLGLSRWAYHPETHGRTNEWGLSVVATYRDRADAKNWGYGALLRTPVTILGTPLNAIWTRTRLDAGGHDDTFGLTADFSRFTPRLGAAACWFRLPSCER